MHHRSLNRHGRSVTRRCALHRAFVLEGQLAIDPLKRCPGDHLCDGSRQATLHGSLDIKWLRAARTSRRFTRDASVGSKTSRDAKLVRLGVQLPCDQARSSREFALASIAESGPWGIVALGGASNTTGPTSADRTSWRASTPRSAADRMDEALGRDQAGAVRESRKDSTRVYVGTRSRREPQQGGDRTSVPR